MRFLKKIGSRLLCTAMCALCLIGNPTAVLAAPVNAAPASSVTAPDAIPAEPAAEAQGIAPAYSTRVHNSPSYGAPVIGRVEDGTKLTVLGNIRGFYIVNCYELTGYIAMEQVIIEDDEYYVNCQMESDETQILDQFSMADALILRSSILDLAAQQIGDPYVFGSSGPYSFDCSGLTHYVFRNNSIVLSRAADSQLKDGVITSRDNLQPGDLVFFREFGSRWLATHVGIYVGNNRFLHASSSRGVRIDDLDSGYFGSRYIGARRIINVSTQGMEQAPNVTAGMQPMARSIYGIRTAD